MSVARSDVSQFKDSKEPNLNDVVDYLASSDPNLVIKAASYLQHLSYGDDSMKAKIRWVGSQDLSSVVLPLQIVCFVFVERLGPYKC